MWCPITMEAKLMDLNNLSWQGWLFALPNDEEKYIVWGTTLFLSSIMHRKVIHVEHFHFFLPYLQDHGLLRSRNFATMATWHNNFSSPLPFTLPLFCYSNFHKVMSVIHTFKCIYCIELNSKPCTVIDLQNVVAKHHFRKGGKLKFSRDSTHD